MVASNNLPELEALSQIIDTLNERFGLELTETDQLLFDQYERDWLSDPEVTDQARNNTVENFKLVFDRNFLRTVISRMDENDALFKRILDDTEFQEAIKDFYGSKIYRQARGDEPSPPPQPGGTTSGRYRVDRDIDLRSPRWLRPERPKNGGSEKRRYCLGRWIDLGGHERYSWPWPR